jgi:hypothetical protein
VFANPYRNTYMAAEYLGESTPWTERIGLMTMSPYLKRWNRRAALGADVYLANSTLTQRRIERVNGRSPGKAVGNAAMGWLPRRCRRTCHRNLFPRGATAAISQALDRFETMDFDADTIRKHAEQFTQTRFTAALYDAVDGLAHAGRSCRKV